MAVSVIDNPGELRCLFELRDSLKRYLVGLCPRVDQPLGFLQQYYAQMQKSAVEKHLDEL